MAFPTRRVLLAATCLFLILGGVVFGDAPLIDAKSDDLSGWTALWTRDGNAGKVAIDDQDPLKTLSTIRVDHAGQRDWSLTRRKHLNVTAGDIYEMTATLKFQGTGLAQVGAIAYDKDDKSVDWFLGGVTVGASKDWVPVKSRLVVPEGVVTLVPRVTGDGPGVAHIAGFGVRKVGNVRDLRSKDIPATLSQANQSISLTFNTADATMSVLDRRNNQVWSQQAVSGGWIVTRASADKSIGLTLTQVESEKSIQVEISLDADLPEVTVSLSGAGEMSRSLAFPAPFDFPGSKSSAEAYVVLPMNEGISYPIDDVGQAGRHLIAYGGHGICMAFFGVTDGHAAQMTLLETPDDASVRLVASHGHLAIAPEWDPQKGQFGYARKLRYIFFDQGGHVAMAKRYREYARQTGLLKTLVEKRKSNPNIDLLVGAVNVWCWDKDGPSIVSEMQAAGIKRILWSNAQSAENLKKLNVMPGVLTSRYDIYEDLMDPTNFPRLRYVHPDWTTPGWPRDLMLDMRGDWVRGWGIETKDGKMEPCGVLCDVQAVPYARARISAELVTRPYRCRFVDTTTAAPWRECYSPLHPMTRSDSRRAKMDLLDCVSREFGMVAGSETGHDAAVPYVDYFEGMLSLGPYRVPDAGRNMAKVWDEVPTDLAKYQLGQKYRLPLWELVYHDCVVAQWYWGDYNNKLPSVWDKRDLFNVLYATPPMFMFDRALWEKQKDRFVTSYQNTCPIARATGYSEMIDHRFLTADRDVQQTMFANGVRVTVNFGSTAYQLGDGVQVKPMGYRVERMPAGAK